MEKWEVIWDLVLFGIIALVIVNLLALLVSRRLWKRGEKRKAILWHIITVVVLLVIGGVLGYLGLTQLLDSMDG